MPTWGSKNDLSKSQFYLTRMKGYIKSLNSVVPGRNRRIELLESGKLNTCCKRNCSDRRDHRMAISSGHVSIQEVWPWWKRHPSRACPSCSPTPSAALWERRSRSKRRWPNGAAMWSIASSPAIAHASKTGPSKIVEAIREVGPAAKTVLTTDAIQTWNPPPPELMRMYVASLFVP